MMQLEQRRVGREMPASDIKAALQIPPTDKSPTAEGHSVDLDILFGSNGSKLTREGERQVDQLAIAIRSDEFKGKSFRITGHTDSTDSDEYNLRLSLKRAYAVRDALLPESRLPTNLIKCEGKGKSDPKYRSDSDDARRLNRRVQITLLN